MSDLILHSAGGICHHVRGSQGEERCKWLHTRTTAVLCCYEAGCTQGHPLPHWGKSAWRQQSKKTKTAAGLRTGLGRFHPLRHPHSPLRLPNSQTHQVNAWNNQGNLTIGQGPGTGGKNHWLPLWGHSLSKGLTNWGWNRLLQYSPLLGLELRRRERFSQTLDWKLDNKGRNHCSKERVDPNQCAGTKGRDCGGT